MLFLLWASLAVAHYGLPVNPELGVPGYPDCYRPAHLPPPTSVDQAAAELVCQQRAAPADAVKIACVGDSITAGVHSTGGNHTYPGQLGIMLGPKYSVTNLGDCGSTMLKKSNKPYWGGGQYKALTSNKWDIVIIMLGTNDAKDPGDGGPNNWLHNCGGESHTTLQGCTFGEDYASMIALVKTLGTKPSGPEIYVQVPPPLMAARSIGANQTVINSVYPKLVRLIEAAGKTKLIDVYTGMGGRADWRSVYPKSCTLETAKTYKPCAWWCDSQSCDQCHPNNNGYTHMAAVVKAGLGL